MEENYLKLIAVETGLSLKQVNNIYTLHAEGSTIPFIARYRKESTGNLDEVMIAQVIDKVKYYTDLAKRKETVIKTIEEQGKLTPELKKRIIDTYDATKLEDIYLPYKPKRKTRASVAIEKGLQPLAEKLWQQQLFDIHEEAAKFTSDLVADAKDALQGARDIIAEWIAEDEGARNAIRKLFTESATLTSRVLQSKKEEEQAVKYKDYFDFSEPLKTSPSHRVLAIRRGEKEGYLIMEILVDKEQAVEQLKRLFIKQGNETAQQVQMAIEDGYNRLLKPAIENEFRLLSKTQADDEAIKVFTENLRQLLLAAPLGARRILAIDPGFRTGCKVVCLDEQGNFLHYTTIFPHTPQNEWEQSVQVIKHLQATYHIEAICYGNGTASKETDKLVRSIQFEKEVAVFMVNESGASIYSASEVAREEFPDQDVTVRGAISIGRRLMDPLSELVKIDPKSIGVGQYQHDVNQTRLKQSLDSVVESCVNYVGVDVNMASKQLLTYVSGLNATLAKNIIDYRYKHKGIKSRQELLKIPMMGPKTFEQCAGFLRIEKAENPLDNSAVHPESYELVERMANNLGFDVASLVSDAELRKKINPAEYISEQAGLYTINDIMAELEKPGRDPRSPIETFRFAEGIQSMEDLRPGMELPGIVTNITNFGAFVDVGVKQDGLVHISHMSNRYISNPNEVVKLGQQVKVWVVDVDVARKRVALSMKNNAQQETKPALQKKKSRDIPAHNNPFHDKLNELKKKFKD